MTVEEDENDCGDTPDFSPNDWRVSWLSLFKVTVFGYLFPFLVWILVNKLIFELTFISLEKHHKCKFSKLSVTLDGVAKQSPYASAWIFFVEVDVYKVSVLESHLMQWVVLKPSKVNLLHTNTWVCTIMYYSKQRSCWICMSKEDVSNGHVLYLQANYKRMLTKSPRLSVTHT